MVCFKLDNILSTLGFAEFLSFQMDSRFEDFIDLVSIDGISKDAISMLFDQFLQKHTDIQCIFISYAF